MSDRWTVRRHGDNSMYQNADALPFAPERAADAAPGTVYLAGIRASGRVCPACPAYIAPKSRIVAVAGSWRHQRCAEAPPRRPRFVERDDDARRVPVPPRVHLADAAFGELRLTFAYDADVVALLKGCRMARLYARWSPESRAWFVPELVWPCVRRGLIARGFDIADDRAGMHR